MAQGVKQLRLTWERADGSRIDLSQQANLNYADWLSYLRDKPILKAEEYEQLCRSWSGSRKTDTEGPTYLLAASTWMPIVKASLTALTKHDLGRCFFSAYASPEIARLIRRIKRTEGPAEGPVLHRLTDTGSILPHASVLLTLPRDVFADKEFGTGTLRLEITTESGLELGLILPTAPKTPVKSHEQP